MTTSTKTRLLGTDDWLTETIYYDDRSRVIQTLCHYPEKGLRYRHTAYDFTGNVLRKQDNIGTDILETVYTYDDRARLLTKANTWNGRFTDKITYVYDALGRLTGRNYGDKVSESLSYNIRGWLTGIESQHFSQTLHYVDGVGVPCYNGNISSMIWHSGSEAGLRGYKFTYDGFSRLKDAIYGEGEQLSNNLNRFNEQVTGYDKNGNILGLLRYGQTNTMSYGLIDNLNLVYNGNQLESVNDNATGHVFGNGMEFKNDLGKPWKYQEGDFTVVRTSMWSPPGCHPVGCGLKLYVDGEGKLVRVEGDENNPITKGRLCVRCLALKDYIYNPSRVIYPMKRDPKHRGQHDKWERITWDEAFAIVKEKRDYFRDTYGPESMAVFSGTGRSGGILVSDMAQAVLGTPNACYTQSGFACYQPRSMSCSHVLGAYYPEMDYAGGLEGTYDNPVYRVPEVIVMWGKMALASNGDGLWGHAVIDLMKRGAKLISVDPRVNWLGPRRSASARASRHRHRHGHGVAVHHHQRGPLRSRLRGEVDVRLRPAQRSGAGLYAREGRRDHVGSRREDPGGGAHVCDHPPVLHAVGPSHRHHRQEHDAGEPCESAAQSSCWR